MSRTSYAHVSARTDESGKRTTRAKKNSPSLDQLGLFGAPPKADTSKTTPPTSSASSSQLGLDFAPAKAPVDKWLKINHIFEVRMGVSTELREQIQDLLNAGLENARHSGLLEIRGGITGILKSNLPILGKHISVQYPDDFQLEIKDGVVIFAPILQMTDKEAGRRTA